MTRPTPRRCDVCGHAFTPRRKSTARLCGSACKQRAYRRRQAQARLDQLKAAIEPAVLLEWAHDDPLLALDLAIREFEIRRGAIGNAEAPVLIVRGFQPRLAGPSRNQRSANSPNVTTAARSPGQRGRGARAARPLGGLGETQR